MKIRIKGNSVRLRLTQTEINTFAEKGTISEVICFGSLANQKLTYTLVKGTTNEFDAKYQENEIKITLPNNQASIWTSTNLVSLEAKIAISDEEKLLILVEKDFKCLQPRANEDETDHYPHPNEGEIFC